MQRLWEDKLVVTDLKGQMLRVFLFARLQIGDDQIGLVSIRLIIPSFGGISKSWTCLRL